MILVRTRLSLLTVAASALLLAGTASAVSLTGPSYPAPGGNTFSTSGAPSTGDVGGLNGHYGGFDTNAFSELYWGPQWGTSGPAAGLDGILHPLAFLSPRYGLLRTLVYA